MINKKILGLSNYIYSITLNNIQFLLNDEENRY